MHIRITPGSFDPAREEEVLRVVESAIIPAFKALPGFQSYEGALDSAAGRFVSVSHWDTEQHAGWSRDQLGDVLSQMQAAGMHLEPPQVYEVKAEA